jgi:hypothetical protein
MVCCQKKENRLSWHFGLLSWDYYETHGINPNRLGRVSVVKLKRVAKGEDRISVPLKETGGDGNHDETLSNTFNSHFFCMFVEPVFYGEKRFGAKTYG